MVAFLRQHLTTLYLCLFTLYLTAESYLISLIFVLRTNFSYHRGVSLSHLNLSSEIPTKVFYQAKRKCLPRSTIVIVHGMSPSGYDDERLVDVAKALAACGYLVVFPDLMTFRRVELSRNSAEVVQRVVQLVSENKELCSEGEVDIVSACVSAGLCMIAAAHEKRIRSVLSFGAPADAQSVWEYLIDSKHPDADYGINAILLNCWEPDNMELCDLLLASLLDDHYKIVGSKDGYFASTVDKVQPENIAKFNRLKHDPVFRKEVFKKVSNTTKFVTGFGSVSPSHYADKMMCKRIVLVHGVEDGIVPSEQSRILLDKLKSTQVEASLCITTLLNHGEKSAVGLKTVPEIFGLTKLFATFFRRYE